MADLSVSTNRPPASTTGVKAASASPSPGDEPTSDDAFASVLARSVDVAEGKRANTASKDDTDEDAIASSEEARTTPAATTPIALEKAPAQSDVKNSIRGQPVPGINANTDPEQGVVTDYPPAAVPLLNGAAQNRSVEQRESPVGTSAVLATNPSADKPESAKTVATAAMHQFNQFDPKGAPPLDKSRTEPIAIERITAERLDTPANEFSFASPATDAVTSPTFRAFFGAAPYGIAQEGHHYDIQSPVSSPEWPRETANVVRIMVTEKISEAAIHVNPPELGPIDVVVKVEGSSTTISFTSNSPETRSLIELHLPKLREALDASGLHLADASVNSGGTQRDSRGTSGSSTSSQEYLIGSASGSKDSKSVSGAGLVTSTKNDRLIDIFA
ncbi:MAG: flagellar hook-length control protein FliK [Burkholderiales bacterium]